MTAILGTNVAAPVVPFDSADVFATHDEIYGRGGFRTVANTTDRDAISTQRRAQGMLVYSIADDTTYQLESDLSTWSTYQAGIVLRYDIGIFYPDKPDANMFIVNLPMVTTVTFVMNLTGSKFKIRVNPTATMTFTLTKNGSSIGTVAFATSGTPTVTFSSNVTFSAGDTFGIQAPSSQDLTGADIGFTFVGAI